MGSNGRSTFSVSEDGPFDDDGNHGSGRRARRIEIRSGGDGVEAYADVGIVVPKDRALYLRHGVGETTIDNVDGRLSVSVAASRERATHVRGSLGLDTVRCAARWATVVDGSGSKPAPEPSAFSRGHVSPRCGRSRRRPGIP
jgi:hypothetical protein